MYTNVEDLKANFIKEIGKGVLVYGEMMHMYVRTQARNLSLIGLRLVHIDWNATVMYRTLIWGP